MLKSSIWTVTWDEGSWTSQPGGGWQRYLACSPQCPERICGPIPDAGKHRHGGVLPSSLTRFSRWPRRTVEILRIWWLVPSSNERTSTVKSLPSGSSECCGGGVRFGRPGDHCGFLRQKHRNAFDDRVAITFSVLTAAGRNKGSPRLFQERAGHGAAEKGSKCGRNIRHATQFRAPCSLHAAPEDACGSGAHRRLVQ